MNYDQRIAEIKEWFKADMLTRFTPPTGVDPKITATDTIEAINANLPSRLNTEQLRNILASITKDIARAARTRTLPVAREFINAASNASQVYRESHTEASQGNSGLDTLKIMEARVKAREPLGDMWLRGSLRQQLIARTNVTEEELDRYVDPTAHTQ
jgi:hypothetical protein